MVFGRGGGGREARRWLEWIGMGWVFKGLFCLLVNSESS